MITFINDLSDIIGNKRIKKYFFCKPPKRIRALICGPRGTGKTSIVRFLFAYLLCQDRKDSTPCYKCSACKSAMDLTSKLSYDYTIIRGKNTSFKIFYFDMSGINKSDLLKVLNDSRKITTAFYYDGYDPDDYSIKPLEPIPFFVFDELDEANQKDLAILNSFLSDTPYVNCLFLTKEIGTVNPSILDRLNVFKTEHPEGDELFANLKKISRRHNWEISDNDIQEIVTTKNLSIRNAHLILQRLSTKVESLDEILETYKLTRL